MQFLLVIASREPGRHRSQRINGLGWLDHKTPSRYQAIANVAPTARVFFVDTCPVPWAMAAKSWLSGG